MNNNGTHMVEGETYCGWRWLIQGILSVLSGEVWSGDPDEASNHGIRV